MLSKMVIINAQAKQKGTRLIICLDYTLNHNQKKKKLNIYLKSILAKNMLKSIPDYQFSSDYI